MNTNSPIVSFQVKHHTDHMILGKIRERRLTLSKVVRRLLRDFAENDYKFDYPDETELGAFKRVRSVTVTIKSKEDIETFIKMKKECFDVNKVVRRLLHQFRDGGFRFNKIEKPVI